jgi:hypothetical protein
MIMKLSLLLLALLVCVAGCERDGATYEERQAAYQAERDAEERLLYSGWIKAHQVTNLTLAEWRALKAEKLLPGQPPPKQGMSAAEAGAVGFIIGNSIRK